MIGVNSPRLAEGDAELPSARLVSQSLTKSSRRSDQSEIWTLMLMQWGQFLDHDITHSPIVRGNSIKIRHLNIIHILSD